MFYHNLKLRKKSSSAKINFTNFISSMNTEVDEALLPYKSALVSYNFNVRNGALTNGYGFKKLCLPKYSNAGEREILAPTSPIVKLWKYKCFNTETNKECDELVMYCQNGEIYSCLIVDDAPFTGKLLDSVISSGVPNAINYRLNSKDTLIFSSKTDGMWKYVQDHTVQKVENAPHIKSMCLHYERLFAIVGGENTRLAFSANLDPTDWSVDLDGGGFIDFQDERGALNKVLSFNDYIYAFRDYGVSRISAYGDQTEFSVSNLFVSSVKLYGDTVTVCGNKILLLARDGIHVFDGYSSKKLNLGIDTLFKDIENNNACAVYYNNKYYLACRLNFNDGEQVGCESYLDGYKNNALIELDLSTNDISITRGVDIASMLVLDGENYSKIAVCFNGEHSDKIGEITLDGKVFGNVLCKLWKSPKSNMGYPTKVKRIKECLIKSKNDCQINISTEKESKTVNVKGSDVSQRVLLNVTGEQMQVSFKSNQDGDTYISCPQITVDIGG